MWNERHSLPLLLLFRLSLLLLLQDAKDSHANGNGILMFSVCWMCVYFRYTPMKYDVVLKHIYKHKHKHTHHGPNNITEQEEEKTHHHHRKSEAKKQRAWKGREKRTQKAERMKWQGSRRAVEIPTEKFRSRKIYFGNLRLECDRVDWIVSNALCMFGMWLIHTTYIYMYVCARARSLVRPKSVVGAAAAAVAACTLVSEEKKFSTWKFIKRNTWVNKIPMITFILYLVIFKCCRMFTFA